MEARHLHWNKLILVAVIVDVVLYWLQLSPCLKYKYRASAKNVFDETVAMNPKKLAHLYLMQKWIIFHLVLIYFEALYPTHGVQEVSL